MVSPSKCSADVSTLDCYGEVNFKTLLDFSGFYRGHQRTVVLRRIHVNAAVTWREKGADWAEISKEEPEYCG